MREARSRGVAPGVALAIATSATRWFSILRRIVGTAAAVEGAEGGAEAVVVAADSNPGFSTQVSSARKKLLHRIGNNSCDVVGDDTQRGRALLTSKKSQSAAADSKILSTHLTSSCCFVYAVTVSPSTLR